MSAWTNTMKSFFTLALSLPISLPAQPVAKLSVQSPAEAGENMDQANSYFGHKKALPDGYKATFQKIQQQLLLWKPYEKATVHLKQLAVKDAAACLHYGGKTFLRFHSHPFHADISYQQRLGAERIHLSTGSKVNSVLLSTSKRLPST